MKLGVDLYGDKMTVNTRYKRFHVFMYDQDLQTICVGMMDTAELYLEEQRRNDALYQAVEKIQDKQIVQKVFFSFYEFMCNNSYEWYYWHD